MESDVLRFQSELASKRRKALRAESSKAGKAFVTNSPSLPEPWILTTNELNTIVEALEKTKINLNQLPYCRISLS